MKFNTANIGNQMYNWAKDLFPICRSITGKGVRETLNYIKKELPDLKIFEVPTGTMAFDWIVPEEWDINDAWIKDENGKKILEFSKNNLHVVGYSEPVNFHLTLAELENHLYSLPNQPEAIPYVTSYYNRTWGFCLSQQQRDSFRDGVYHVYIDSSFKKGNLNYAELYIRGKSDKEIFLSTYICHPSMANNELSGPVVTLALCKYLTSLNDLNYSYRIIFVPETIGSIVYLSKNFEVLKRNVIAGYNITCVGDNRDYSYLPSRSEITLSDKVAKHCLHFLVESYKKYSWLERGSDERQYCSPGIDLPIASIMRTKYGEYPEYHTSLDNLDFISSEGLEGAFNVLSKAILSIEYNCKPKYVVYCEPQLGKRGLYPNISTKGSANHVQNMMNLLSYADGETELIDICDKINVPIWEIKPVLEKLVECKLLVIVKDV
jgi:aminopeptidase-like protein